MHNYGWFLCQQRRFAEADAQFERALAQPQYRDVARTLLAQGVCQARAGKWAQAERTLSRSYELDPANPVTAYNLGEVLLPARRTTSVRASTCGASTRSPTSPTRRACGWPRASSAGWATDGACTTSGASCANASRKSTETLLFERGRFDD